MAKSKNRTTKEEQKKAPEVAEQEARERAEKKTPEAAEETPRDELEKLKNDLQEAEDKFVRSKADLDNYRKRVQKEAAEIRQYTRLSTVEQFLPVFDHFQMAMQHVGENPDVETLKQGMDMILNEFSRTFESLGVERVNAEGRPFDPNEHEAMAQEPSDEIPEGHVLRQWKCGYRMGERLLRPATVVVSSGPAEEKDPEQNKDQDK